MWRLLHDGIGVLNKVGRFVEEIATDCHPCQSSPETAEHLFLRCPLIQAILFASPLGLRLENNSELSSSISMLDISTSSSTDIQWTPPPENTIKININVGLKDDYSVNVVVARNHYGAFVGSETSIGTLCSPLIAEANGFILAARLANRLNLHNILIESDSISMLKYLNDVSTRVPWRVLNIVNELRAFISIFSQVVFQFVRRPNDIAHVLAKFAVKHHVQAQWTSSQPPSCISIYLLADTF
ncbi:uncharacterized protein LOC113353058 [Papaver somniferum]|uniref:uncharacterized protein LOC113353058 n=1 Tax=Papaver somniferum TaxID=3469 RepID=UPI000E6F9380|nr:uncharacterized protein LOC113353058 [Papaver somniferum]